MIDTRLLRVKKVGRLAGCHSFAKDNFPGFGADTTTAASNILKELRRSLSGSCN
jgi:Asp-tRNA(Asn)/Glu-tRNA(Gln) amidotransferase A subunit family amidase